MSLVDDLKKVQQDMHSAIDGLTVKELDRKSTMGDWSVRDVLLHIAMWEGEVLKELAIWRAGHKIDWAYVKDHKGILRFNEFWINSMKHLSAKKVIEMFDATHDALVSEVSSIAAPVAGKKRRALPKWVRQITVDHNRTHLRKILAYRKTLGK